MLATSDMGMQAVELPHGRGRFWGVQYHPEYSYTEIAATALRYAEVLLREQWFADRAALEAFVADLKLLQERPQRSLPGLEARPGTGDAGRAAEAGRAAQLARARGHAQISA